MTDWPFGAAVPLIIDPPTDQDGNIVVPATISISVQRPDTAVDGPFVPVYDSIIDQYVYDYSPPVTTGGEYRWRGTTVSPDGAIEGSFYVYPAYGIATDAWKPTLADIAAMVPTRTIDSAGTEQNTFTATTSPTDTQVTGYINRIVAEIAGVVGEVPSQAFDQAKHTATLGAAWLVERSYPPTADVQNVANDFVNDYRQSLQLLKLSARNADLSGARAVSVSLDAYTWPTT